MLDKLRPCIRTASNEVVSVPRALQTKHLVDRFSRTLRFDTDGSTFRIFPANLCVLCET